MKNIYVYTSNTCPYCNLIKEYLKKKGVEYIEKNVSTDKIARSELIKKGYRGVPVTIIGDDVVLGFDKEKLEELL